MRTINISTSVFAGIWASREEGEETEDAILRRILNCDLDGPTSAPPASGPDGFHDQRNGVHFPEGFEIFRVYKGTEYRARATGGHWLLLNDSKRYGSLHKLSSAVVVGNENSWHNWKYFDSDGFERVIHMLRDETVVATRS